MIIHSIKWRLQLWHGFLLGLLVTGLMAGFYEFERRARTQAVDNELREALTPLMPRFAPPGGRGGPERGPLEREWRPPPPEDEPPFGRTRPEELRPGNIRQLEPISGGRIYFIAWSERGERVAVTENAPAELERPPSAPPGGPHQIRRRGPFRELIHVVPTGRCLLVGTSLDPLQQQLRQLGMALAGIGLTITVIGFAVGWWLASSALRPIAEIGRTAQAIAAGNLSRRINTAETESELGQLAAVLNSTFARLETAFAQQQQFTSDAAHELRTPVSVILTQVQSTLNKERSGAEYRETLEACQRAAQRMKRLIESLLELARFDAGQEQLQRVPFDLAAKTRECIELLQPLATARGVTLSADLPETNCSGDPERLSQVIANLLTNAVTYNKPDGEVRVTVAAQNNHAVLTVTDTGIGIATEAAAHVFKRFYRADQSRTAAAGSSGLGLAICQSIVTAHGGTLDFTSEPGRGTTFTVRLPTV